MTLAEYLRLVGTGVANLAYLGRLLAREAREYGGRRWWWRLRLAMALEWNIVSPIRVVRVEGAESGVSEEDLTYGETPPSTAHRILERLAVGPEDHVVELGCGRGHLALVAALAFGSRATGVDALPTFARKGERVARSLCLEERVSFVQGDYRVAPLPEGTVYFLAGTSLEPDSWRRVCRSLAQVPGGTRAASLSASLPRERWEDLGREGLPFSWGEATVHYHRRR